MDGYLLGGGGLLLFALLGDVPLCARGKKALHLRVRNGILRSDKRLSVRCKPKGLCGRDHGGELELRHELVFSFYRCAEEGRRTRKRDG